MEIENTIEFLIGAALFLNGFFLIPQIILFLKNKSISMLSMLFILGIIIIHFILLLHGLMKNYSLLITGYIVSIIICLLITIWRSYFKANLILDTRVAIEEILEQCPGHIYWKDQNGVVLGCNRENWKDFGGSPENHIGKTDYDLFPREQAERLRKIDLEVMQSGKLKIVEEESTAIDGKNKLYLSYKVPLIRNNKIIGILGVSLDITDAKKKETERLELLENIIALMPGHVYWVNRDNIYLGCNDNQAKSAGLKSRKEIIGKRNKDLPWNYNTYALPEKLDNINKKVMTTGESIILEEPAQLQNGELATFLSNKSPLFNSDGKIIGMVGISIDITEHKLMQKKLHEAHHKLEGMTLVSASIAHELRTPLASLNANAEIIRDMLPSLLEAYNKASFAELDIPNISKRALEGLKEIPQIMLRETQGANTFISMLLTNLNPNLDDSSEIFSIADCVKEALERYPFKPQQRKWIRWQTDTDFQVKGKPTLIVHILFNLLKNALFYIRQDGSDYIEIKLKSAGVYNKLIFMDTGAGISPEALPYIFDRFYSRTHNSSGIGLTYCKTVMEALGGSITCESSLGNYTRFTLNFPKESLSK